MIDSRLDQSSIATGEQITDTGATRITVGGQVADTFAPDGQATADGQPQDTVVSEQEIRQFILACKEESFEAHKEMRDTWKALWDAAQANQDFSKKKIWQAKVIVPEIPAIIKKATSLICRILLKTKNYFDLDPGLEGEENLPGKISNPLLEGQKAGIRYHLEKAGMEELIREWIEAAFTYGIGYLKLWWTPKTKTRVTVKQNQGIETVTDQYSGQPVTQRRYDAFFERETYHSSELTGIVVPPASIYTDVDHTFFIEECMTTLDQVFDLAEGGLLSKEAVNRLVALDYGDSQEETDRLKSLNLSTHQNPFRKKVKLQTFWGNVLDRKGKLVIRNAQVILANEMYVLNPDTTENPFWHQGPPLVEISPIRCLFRKEGKGLAENCLSMQKAINDMTNMSLDGLMWKLLKLFEVDPDRLRNPQQFKELDPGTPIYTQGGPGRAINEVQISDIPMGSLKELDIFRRSIQNDTSVNDFLLSGQQNQVHTTATEASIRSSEGNSMFEGISRVIEGGIEEAITMVQSLMVQYWDDFSDPALKSLAQKYGLPFAAPSRELRLAFIDLNIRVKVRGISGYFQKSEDLKKYVDFLTVVGKVPEFKMRMNLRELLDRIVRAFMFNDPDKLTVSPEVEQMIKQAEQIKLLMEISPPPALMGMGNQGPGPQAPHPGLGGPPPPSGPPHPRPMPMAGPIPPGRIQ